MFQNGYNNKSVEHVARVAAWQDTTGQRSTCTGEPLPTTVLQGTDVVDTRGLRGGASGSMLPFLGQPLAVRWVRLEDVDPVGDTLRFEAQSKGAAVWFRGEGAWFHKGEHYFVCSNAGDAGEGQVWCYDPRRETVRLIVESTAENLLDGPDNMTVARDGTIYLCGGWLGRHPGQSEPQPACRRGRCVGRPVRLAAEPG